MNSLLKYSLSVCLPSTALTMLVMLVMALVCTVAAPAAQARSEALAPPAEPLRVLMVTGGGWHDYDTQKGLLEQGLTERIGNISFTIDHESGTATDARLSRFADDRWAAQYDLVVYNHCHSHVEDKAYIDGIVQAHVEHELPAVMLHCAMHSFRSVESNWQAFAGVRSVRHEAHRAFTVENMLPVHAVMANFPRTWRTPNGELYEIIELMLTATPLARAWGVDTHRYHEVAWVNEYEGVRVFGTTLGHHNETMGSDVNLNLVAAGLLWAAGKLDDSGRALPGFEGDRGLGWISLWDGQTLNGWRASENTESFQVEDGKIVVDGPRSHLFYEGPVVGGDFVNFEFKTDVYTYPRANSGVFFHSRFQDFGWPQYGYEAQVNATHRDPRKTGSLYAVSDLMDNAPHNDNEWFHYHIQVDGRDIRFWVDGAKVLDFTEPDDRTGTIRLNRGTISLQAHDPESRIYYRDLYIRLWPE